jgi:hypothetical protein
LIDVIDDDDVFDVSQKCLAPGSRAPSDSFLCTSICRPNFFLNKLVDSSLHSRSDPRFDQLPFPLALRLTFSATALHRRRSHPLGAKNLFQFFTLAPLNFVFTLPFVLVSNFGQDYIAFPSPQSFQFQTRMFCESKELIFLVDPPKPSSWVHSLTVRDQFASIVVSHVFLLFSSF